MAPRSKAKKRAPLMESDTEDALRRRGTELLGLILMGIGALAFLVIWTYSPDDPSLFSATDEAPRNALGIIGASLADPLHRALGMASSTRASVHLTTTEDEIDRFLDALRGAQRYFKVEVAR